MKSVVPNRLWPLLLFVCTLPAISWAAVYPSNYDIVYHRISLTVDPGTSGAISNASVTTYFKPRINNFTQMGFDMDQALNVGSVKYHGSNATYTHSSNVILITVPNIAVAGTLDSITINYSGTPVAPATSIPSGYNYSAGSIYTLGEAFRGNTWWPCRDSLVDKIDSVDIIITTPSAYRAGANGVVTETIVGSNRVCTWKTRTPIAPYMVNFAASDYVNYQFNATSLTHTVPVMNYLHTADNTTTYKNNLLILQTVMPKYATLLNTDYPFYDEKYGTAECGSGWGALEVQSMTFIDRTSYAGSGYTLAHELAHQWFGDKLTTSDWHQIWLNEGFAQFFESVIFPEQTMTAATALSKRQSLKSSVNSTSTVYVPDISNADKIFFGSSVSQPYEKGAMLLSMLREWVGDAQFYTALHDYLNAPGLAYNYTYVDSLKKYMQMQTPNDLTQFFNDWVNQKGRVTYAVKYQYVTNGVYLQLTQSPTSAGAGYFDMPVPIEIKNGSTLDTTIVVIDRNGKLYNSVTGNTYGTNTIFFKLSATPTLAPVFDPDASVLATTSAITSSSTLNNLITLPVQQINLSATGTKENTRINWKIASDEPLDAVIIERSADGDNFSTLAKINTTTVEGNVYQGEWLDDQSGDRTQYYRLKTVKKDGEFTYSAVKTVKVAAAGEIKILPNPVHNYFTLTIPATFATATGKMNMNIYNNEGQLVLQQQLDGHTQSATVSCESFVPGVYNLVLVNDRQQLLKLKFLK